METEIHERIINDRRTMVVVDDDRWVHHPSLMKFCDSTTLQLMTMINQWWRNWYINMHICRSFKWKLIEDGYCIWQQELKWKWLISWRYAAKSNLEKLRIDLEDENLRLRFAIDNILQRKRWNIFPLLKIVCQALWHLWSAETTCAPRCLSTSTRTGTTLTIVAGRKY